jgi:hypothetical protein
MGENGMCELRYHANLRNKTTSRGIRGYERNPGAGIAAPPGAGIAALDIILAGMYNKEGRESMYLVV